jgi:hypothetical protein
MLHKSDGNMEYHVNESLEGLNFVEVKVSVGSPIKPQMTLNGIALQLYVVPGYHYACKIV